MVESQCECPGSNFRIRKQLNRRDRGLRVQSVLSQHTRDTLQLLCVVAAVSVGCFTPVCSPHFTCIWPWEAPIYLHPSQTVTQELGLQDKCQPLPGNHFLYSNLDYTGGESQRFQNYRDFFLLSLSRPWAGWAHTAPQGRLSSVRCDCNQITPLAYRGHVTFRTLHLSMLITCLAFLGEHPQNVKSIIHILLSQFLTFYNIYFRTKTVITNPAVSSGLVTENSGVGILNFSGFLPSKNTHTQEPEATLLNFASCPRGSKIE